MNETSATFGIDGEKHMFKKREALLVINKKFRCLGGWERVGLQCCVRDLRISPQVLL